MQTVYVHALDAKTGNVIWSWDFSDGAAGGRENAHPTIQGYVQLSGARVIVPGGLILDAATGTQYEYEYRGGGGKKATPTIVADGKQFTSSEEGTISCLADGKVKTRNHARVFKAISPAKDEWKEKARTLIKVAGLPADKLRSDKLRADEVEVKSKRATVRVKTFLNIRSDGGYALIVGAGSGQLIDALIQESNLDLIVLEPNAQKTLALRRKYDDAGLYGSRLHVLPHDSLSAGLPPCMFNLITSESAQVFQAIGQENFIRSMFEALRPYGGTFFLPLTDKQHSAFAKEVKEAGLPRVGLTRNEGGTTVRRIGSLPGAGQWTHTAGDAGNTLFSPDDRVKPPFGVLWYGGDAAALPHFDRAASPHAPLISGGRMLFQGPDRLFAVDVYTGRVIWQIKIEPHQTPYRKEGSPVGNYGWRKPLWYSIVALEHQIYLANGSRILVLNPATGNEERRIPLPAGHEYIKGIRRTGGILLAITPTGVLAWDRNSDKPLWSRSTGGVDLQRTESWNGKTKLPGFFAAGNGKVFLVAGVSADELKRLRVAANNTKGDKLKADEPESYDKNLGKPVGTLAILALNLKDGKPLWAEPFTQGYPSLQYSEAQDVLIQGPMYNGGHGFDEALRGKNPPTTNTVAYRGKDGRILWKSYNEAGLYILHSGGLVTQEARMYNFTSGALLAELAFRRGICCPIGASKHFLTFRTGGQGNLGMRGPAGYYDLSTQHAGSLYSFRPGCSNNLTVGDGVMVAPMYQRGCTCTFPIWTSLAMTPRPHSVPSVSQRLNRLAWRLGKDSPASLLNLRKRMAAATGKGADLGAKTMASFLREVPGIAKDLQSVASYRETGDQIVSSELLGITLDVAFTGTPRGADYNRKKMTFNDPRRELTKKDRTLQPTVALRGAYDGEVSAIVRFEVTPANRLGPLPAPRTVRLAAGKSMNIPWDTFEYTSENEPSDPFTLKVIADVQLQALKMRLESVIHVDRGNPGQSGHSGVRGNHPF